ncbi:haloacid dehalogenase superfamily enzyme, subfamily IA [Sphaerochaeta pleomorpha str. Grapes]|uniref:phosphoglycolate phosphatase n=1 Tax=Sphaerochaeta pleomorpha (strain ATCC BAA-1885 / DSM 22778 / Grapes) TaxID=158190 RepID=G8QXR6_SPHPG|nr:HAD family hydrolase [Sphaerochaeta pleomorpha]AEV30710.1 haloacid dehalogenase superfamily enzyme, subfamily IA [Sphaerochaeta pleomorpha str. Grapes]
MQESRIQAVLFDLDGTLVDTIEDITAALNAALADEGLAPLTLEQGKKVVGRGLRNAIAGALELQGHKVTETRMDSLFSILTDYYIAHATVYCKPYEGISTLLEALNRKRIPLGVFSNKDDVLTKVIVKEMFPKIRFEWIRGMRSDFPRKPEPAGVLHFCKNLGLPVGSLLYVGDSEVDWQTAQNAGCLHVLVTWGFRKRSELLTIEGARLVDSVKELEDACNGL